MDNQEDNKEEVNITDLLKEIKENLGKQNEKKTLKKWKMPFSGRVSKAKIKKGYVTVAYIGQNKAVDFYKVLIDEGVYKDKNGIPHAATARYMMSYKGKPLIIQPEWSQTPFSPDEHLDKTESENNSSLGGRLLLNYLENQQVKPKGSMGGFGWIILILAVIGIGYYAWSNGYFQ